MSTLQISIYRLGYVVSVSSACLSIKDYQVIRADINPEKTDRQYAQVCFLNIFNDYFNRMQENEK